MRQHRNALRNRVVSFVVVLGLAVLFPERGTAQYPDCPAGCRILLIGSSHTVGIDPKLTNIVESLGYEPFVQSRTGSGWTLQNHDESTQTTNKIQEGWDWVVLQEAGSNFGTPQSPFVNNLIAKAKASNPDVRILLYLLYPPLAQFTGTGYQTMIASLRSGAPTIAHQLDVRTAPIGQAVVDFHDVSTPANFPTVNTLFGDADHLGEKGDYLAALTIAAAMFRELPETVWTLGTVSSWASQYKQIARDAVTSEAAFWNIPLTQTVTRYVNGSAQDAVKREIGGTVVSTGLLAPLADDDVGLRFANVDIPPGATIVDASVSAVQHSNAVGSDPNPSSLALTLAPQANPPFVDSGLSVGADVCFFSTSCYPLQGVGNYSALSSVKAGLQSLVDHQTWWSGASVTVHVSRPNWRSVQFRSYDTHPATPPKLVARYFVDNTWAE